MQAWASLPHFGERWRVFWVALTLAIWLFIIDGLNFSYNYDTYDNDIYEDWAKVLVMISGYAFFATVTPGAFMLLGWVMPSVATILLMFGAGVCGVARLIATLAGFNDFWEESYLDSTTSGTTDVAIFALQIYLLMDAFYLYRVQDGPAGGSYQSLYGSQAYVQQVAQPSPGVGAVKV